MGNCSTPFNCLEKSVGGPLTPSLKRRLLGKPIESRIDFDSGKSSRIVFQMTSSRAVFRIKGLGPALIHPAAGPDINPRGAHTFYFAAGRIEGFVGGLHGP